MDRRHTSPSWAARFTMGSTEQIDAVDADFRVDPAPRLTLGVQHAGRLALVTEQGKLPLTTCGISGMLDRPRQFAYTERVSHTLLHFRPEAAYAVLGIGAHALSGQSLAIADLLGPSVSNELFERVCEAPDRTARVRAMVQVLDALPERRTVSLFVQEAKRRIEASNGALPIHEIRRALGVNERRLERRFLEEVGLPPKAYARLVRFTHAAHLARTADTLADVACIAGYSDPAHFAREVKRYTGKPASALRTAV